MNGSINPSDYRPGLSGVAQQVQTPKPVGEIEQEMELLSRDSAHLQDLVNSLILRLKPALPNNISEIPVPQNAGNAAAPVSSVGNALRMNRDRVNDIMAAVSLTLAHLQL